VRYPRSSVVEFPRLIALIHSLSARLIIVLLGLVFGGCASQEPSRPDVLSGEAALEDVVAAADAAARARSYVAALVLYRRTVSREPDPCIPGPDWRGDPHSAGDM